MLPNICAGAGAGDIADELVAKVKAGVDNSASGARGARPAPRFLCRLPCKCNASAACS